jgi:hypothetical protein
MKAEARYACPACGHVFNVDLPALLALKGFKFTLIDRRPTCKISRCGGRGFFLAAADRGSYLVPLLSEVPPGLWRIGLRPMDFEPPSSPAPPGGSIAYPDWREVFGGSPLRIVTSP